MQLSSQTYAEGYEQALNSLYIRISDEGLEATQQFLKERLGEVTHDSILEAVQSIVQDNEIPADVVRKNRSVDVRLQRSLLRYFAALDDSDVLELAPRYPLSQTGYQSVQDVFRICDTYLVATNRGQRYQYFTLVANRWVREESLREMIRASLRFEREREPNVDVNRVIRQLVDSLNSQVRFYYVRATKCYCDLLQFEYARRGIIDNVYPYTDFSLPNYLELGMSNPGTIQLHNLGLSRTTAIEVYRYCQRRGAPTDNFLGWIRERIGQIASEMPRPIRIELSQVFEF